MRRRSLPLVLAAAAALPAGVITTTIDSRYEATASTRLQILFGGEEVGDLRSLAGVPDIAESDESPLLPGGATSLARVEDRTARRLRWEVPFEPDDVRVIDTAAELGSAKFSEPGVRRLKTKAVAEDPRHAARLANLYLAEYVRERNRSIDRLLSEARDRFDARSTPTLSRIPRANGRELMEAADIAIDLHGGVLTYDVVPAVTPEERISPRPVRDAIVAALIGALVGWLLSHRGRLTFRRVYSPAPVSDS